MNKYRNADSMAMDKQGMIKELEDIRMRIIRIEAELLPTEKATPDEIRSIKQALREHKAGKTIRVA